MQRSARRGVACNRWRGHAYWMPDCMHAYMHAYVTHGTWNQMASVGRPYKSNPVVQERRL